MIISLITLVVCVGLLFAFRYADKNNRSLEKVKKFSDQAKQELDDYFKERTRNLENSGVELDTKQSMSVAAVKKLEKLYGDFNQRVKELEDRNKLIDKMEERISQYDKVLSDLSDMTGRVEENLLRIKKESAIVDKLNSQLASQKKEIDAIAAKVPQVESGFQKTNAQQLQKMAESLLVQFNQKAQEISDSTEDAVATNKEILLGIKNAYDQD